MPSFTFNGRSLTAFAADNDCEIIVTGVSRGLTPSFNFATAEVAGRAGGYVLGRSVGARSITVEIVVKCDTASATRAVEKALASWLATEVSAPLVFDDEPTSYFAAQFADANYFGEYGPIRSGSISFTASDPYIYDSALTIEDIEKGSTLIDNTGGVAAWPTARIPITSDATFLAMQVDGKRLLIGSPARADVATVATSRVDLSDDLSSMSGWSVGTNAQGGAVAGTMASDGSAFSPLFSGGSFGSGTTWHGPTVRRALANTTNDFTAEALVRFDNSLWAQVTDESVKLSGYTWKSLDNKSVDNTKVQSINVRSASGTRYTTAKGDLEAQVSNGVTQIRRKAGSRIADGETVKVSYKYKRSKAGRLEMYLLDANGVRIGRIGISDSSNDTAAVRFHASVWNSGASTVLADEELATTYQDLTGLIRLARDTDGRWTASIAKRNASTGELSEIKTWPAKSVATSGAAAIVELHAAQHGTIGAADPIRFDAVSVVSVLNPGSTAPTVIARAGDTITIDCSRGKVMAGTVGQPRMDLVDVGSEFPSLPAGESSVDLETDGGVGAAKIEYRRRWL